MLMKDQLRVRMDQLNMTPAELGRRVGVSGQSVRHWIDGRNFPTKAKTYLLEQALTCKLDFSEGQSEQSVTVDETLRMADIETFMAISKLPPDVQGLITQLAQRFLELQSGASSMVRDEPDLSRLPAANAPARTAVVPTAPLAPVQRKKVSNSYA